MLEKLSVALPNQRHVGREFGKCSSFDLDDLTLVKTPQPREGERKKGEGKGEASEKMDRLVIWLS